MIDLDGGMHLEWENGALVISGSSAGSSRRCRNRNEAFDALAAYPDMPPAVAASVLAFAMVLALDEQDRRSSALIEDSLMAALRAASLRCPDNAHVAAVVERLHDCFDLHSHLLDAAETRARLLMEARRIDAARLAVQQRIATQLDACDPLPILADGHPPAAVIEHILSGNLRHVAIQAWACAINGDATVATGRHAVAIACQQVDARCTLICPSTAVRSTCHQGRDLGSMASCDMIPAELLNDRCSEQGWNTDLRLLSHDLPPSPL